MSYSGIGFQKVFRKEHMSKHIGVEVVLPPRAFWERRISARVRISDRVLVLLCLYSLFEHLSSHKVQRISACMQTGCVLQLFLNV